MTRPKRGVMIIVSAPSGAGKTTLCRELLKIVPALRFSVSYTTRPPRHREKNGKDYFFVSPEEFERMERRGEFIEREEIFGNLYGTSRKNIDSMLASGDDVLLDVDTRGAKNLKQALNEGIYVFILPPSLQALEERLKRRGSEDEPSMIRRLERAVDEINDNYWYDYIIFNDRVKTSVSVLQSIYVAEKNRRIRQLDKVAEVIRSKEAGRTDGKNYR
ncbi:MAG: hypothetical protein AVO39_07200 [delta proteobacterium MLS_D]|jgi:guanylate kinase|nr:MAG: hypothetical protein AVO39_07200 [delta proteobacterium MLS_D]